MPRPHSYLQAGIGNQLCLLGLRQLALQLVAQSFGLHDADVQPIVSHNHVISEYPVEQVLDIREVRRQRAVTQPQNRGVTHDVKQHTLSMDR